MYPFSLTVKNKDNWHILYSANFPSKPRLFESVFIPYAYASASEQGHLGSTLQSAISNDSTLSRINVAKSAWMRKRLDIRSEGGNSVRIFQLHF